jgi:hypothetical protein
MACTLLTQNWYAKRTTVMIATALIAEPAYGTQAPIGRTAAPAMQQVFRARSIFHRRRRISQAATSPPANAPRSAPRKGIQANRLICFMFSPRASNRYCGIQTR